VRKAVLFCLLLATVALHGCSAGGEISSEQQHAKKDALKAVAKKIEGPNFQQRPQ
jgi:hypothetical protein